MDGPADFRIVVGEERRCRLDGTGEDGFRVQRTQIAQDVERGVRPALVGQGVAQVDGGQHPPPGLLLQSQRFGEPGYPARPLGGELQFAEFGEDRGPSLSRQRFVQRAAQIERGGVGPAGPGRFGRRVQEGSVDGRPASGRTGRRCPSGRAGGGGAQQMPGHCFGPVAPASAQFGRAVVQGLPVRAGPAVEDRSAQQRMREARDAGAGGSAQQPEPDHRGDPARDAVGIGPGELGEEVDEVVARVGLAVAGGPRAEVGRSGPVGEPAFPDSLFAVLLPSLVVLLRSRALQFCQRAGHQGAFVTRALQPPRDSRDERPRVQFGAPFGKPRLRAAAVRRAVREDRPQVVEQRVQQQRIAGAGPYAAVQPGVAGVRAQGCADQFLGGGAAQRRERVHPHRVGGQGVREARSGRGDVVLPSFGDHHEDRHSGQPPGGLGQPVPGGLVGEVHVLHGDQQGGRGRVLAQ